MVGRGCKQDRELAKKYAAEACRGYSLFSVFIDPFSFSQLIPSLNQVLDDPELLSFPTVEEFQNSSRPLWRHAPAGFRIFYPELFTKGLFAPSQVYSQESFSAIWPEFYQLFNWETYRRYPWRKRRIPYWLLQHRPQFAELIPINWKKAKQNDIFLVSQHQKFERYIKPEQFSQADFEKVLHIRPEYERFAVMQNSSGHKQAVHRKKDPRPGGRNAVRKDHDIGRNRHARFDVPWRHCEQAVEHWKRLMERGVPHDDAVADMCRRFPKFGVPWRHCEQAVEHWKKLMERGVPRDDAVADMCRRFPK